MSDLSPKALKRLLNLHAVAFGSEHAPERAKAIEDLITLLKKHDKTGNDLPKLFLRAQMAENATRNDNESPPEPPPGVANQGDRRQGRRSPIDTVMEGTLRL
jgi:hypothetical protein